VFEFDSCKFPIVFINATSETPTMKNLQESLDSTLEVVKSAKEKIVIVFDLSKSKLLSSEQRVHLGNWYNQYQKMFQEKVLGIAIVNPPILSTLLIRGVFLITGNNVATLFNKMDPALKWAHGLFEKYREVA
jgi:hypothetical protein